MEAPGQPSVVELWRPTHEIYGGPLVVEAPGQPSVVELAQS